MQGQLSLALTHKDLRRFSVIRSVVTEKDMTGGKLTRPAGHRPEFSWGNVLALAAALGVTCEAFTVKAADRPPAPKGRPKGKPASTTSHSAAGQAGPEEQAPGPTPAPSEEKRGRGKRRGA